MSAQLPIHRRRVMDHNGAQRTSRLVDCPADGRAVPLEACAKCGYGRGEALDPSLAVPVLECDRVASSDVDLGATYDVKLRVVPVLRAATRDVLCVKPETPISEVRRALRTGAAGCLPVIDAQGLVLGMIAPIDLIEEPEATTAGEAMCATLQSLTEMTPLTRAAAIMAYEGVHHLPVVNASGALVGVLSSLDVLRHLGADQGYVLPTDPARRRRSEGAELEPEEPAEVPGI